LGPDAEARIVDAVRKTAPAGVWRELSDEALARARRGRGTCLEAVGLDAYEQKSGRRVFRRNQDRFRQQFGSGAAAFCVAGRVDGFEQVDGRRWVVEHKRRQRRLFGEIPRYEEVQCQVYMVLSDTPACRWVQTMGPRVDFRALTRCATRWRCIRARLCAMAALLRKLRAGALCPPVAELESLQKAGWAAAPEWPAGSAPEVSTFQGVAEQHGSVEVLHDSASLSQSIAEAADLVASGCGEVPGPDAAGGPDAVRGAACCPFESAAPGGKHGPAPGGTALACTHEGDAPTSVSGGAGTSTSCIAPDERRRQRFCPRPRSRWRTQVGSLWKLASRPHWRPRR